MDANSVSSLYKMKQSLTLQRLSASLFSLFLSYWIIFLNPVINHDGILYLQAADKFLQGDWAGAARLYSWPFYSLLIAVISKVTTLDLESSAHLFTAFSAGMLTYVFLCLVRELDRDKTIPFFIAFFVIVFFSELNETRSLIIREHGYWAFYLLALLFFIRCYKSGIPSYAIGWNLSIAIATLFRIEGAVFLLLLPLILLSRSGWHLPERLKLLLASHLVTISACLGLALWHFAGGETGWLSASRLADPLFFINKFLSALGGGIAEHASIIEEAILNKYSEDAAVWAALFIPAVIIAIALIKALTPLYSILFFYKPRRGLSRLDAGEGAVLVWVAVLNFLIFLVVALARYFLFERFVMPLVFILLLVLSFNLASLFARWREKGGRKQPWRRKWIYYLIFLLLIANSGEALIHLPGDSKRYLKTAGLYLRHNVADNTRIFTNNVKLRFYSGRLYNDNLPAHEALTVDRLKEWQKGDYDYFAFWVDHRSPLSREEISNLVDSDLLGDFGNRAGDRVLIYRK